jgi:pimeloyl-ACP methyl ester carboxylesterase
MPYHPPVRWVKRLSLLVAFLFISALGVAAGGSLLSLDWGREHTARTEALPLLAAGESDGLVRIEANGMVFRGRVAGLANEGPGLVLLHGFPETSAMWLPLIDEAAAAGYRVVAFDQRGYSPGARPEGIEAYETLELISDVVAVADAVGFERFHLVGHDWGCVVGWGVAIRHPERVTTWSGMSIPHPGTLLADLRKDLPAYIKVFTAPLVPEALLSFNGMANLRQSYSQSSPEQRAEYLATFSEPGALTAALDWYRAITSSLDGADAVAGPATIPTLFVWGEREGWVTDDALARQRKLVTGPYTELEVDAGHFVMQERPAEVVAAVMEHLEQEAGR